MPKCIKLEWSVPPVFMPCAVGEPVDYRGLSINAIYDNGTRETVEMTGKMFHDSNILTAGAERKCVVTYGGEKLIVYVPLLDAYVDYIDAQEKEPLIFYEGEKFDKSKIIVTVVYSNGSRKEVTNYKIIPYAPLELNQKNISVKYGKCKAGLDITVLPKSKAINESSDENQPVSNNIPDNIMPSSENSPIKSPRFQPEEQPDNQSQLDQTPQKNQPNPADFMDILKLFQQNPQFFQQLQQFQQMQQTTREQQTLSESEKTSEKNQSQKSEIPMKKVIGISVARVPNHQKYLVGDRIADLKGGKLDIIYSDNSVGQIDMIADGEVILDSSKPGRGTVSFECFGKPVAYSVEILQPKLVRLSIKEYPAKRDYIEGDYLDLSGLILEAVYNDGSIRDVKGLQSRNFVLSRVHNQEGVTLRYDGVPFNVPVHVEKCKEPVVPVGVILSGMPEKSTYIEREAGGINLTGAQLMVQMSDGHREFIAITQEMLYDADISSPGKKNIKIVYEGYEMTIPIIVVPRTIQSIEIQSAPKKTSYIVNEKIDLKGVIINACYDNGEKEPIADYSVSPEIMKENDRILTFSYRGLEAKMPITVNVRKAVLLDWITQPTKRVYYTKETEFSCSGGKFLVKMNDDTTEEIYLTKEMITGFQTDRIGPVPVVVRYENLTLPFSITVIERVLLGLKVTKKPKVDYIEGEEFDPTGMIVEALYTGETSEIVGVTYLPYGALREDTTSMMLVYQDKAVVLPITVSKPGHKPIIATEYEDSENPEKSRSEPVGEQPVSDFISSQESKENKQDFDTNKEYFSENSVNNEENNQEILVNNNEIKRVNVPNFYPSTFCMRFDVDPEKM